MQTREARDGKVRERADFLFVERELKDVEVFLEVKRLVRARNRGDSLIEAPADQDLRRRCAVASGDFAHDGIVEELSAPEGPPGLHDDPRATAEVDGVRLRVARVNLELIDHGRHAGAGEKRHKVVREKVRDADRVHDARFIEVFEGSPGPGVAALPEEGVAVGRGPVNEERVEVARAEFRKKRLHRLDRVFVRVVRHPDFGGEEKGFARNAAVSDRFAEKRCVVVDLCRVKRPVPRFDRGRENAVRLFGIREVPGAETQSRQPRPVLERNAAVGMIEHDEVPFVFLFAQC